ncbi:hypothetical protein ACH4L5_22140 [Streptomyces sp. NPDC017405]|uniref:allene oxide cyclase barrel-like domain-containing protein n=1 Tax=unclassified Streptomyces TaxID=2593676 RepID=UPI0037B6C63D
MSETTEENHATDGLLASMAKVFLDGVGDLGAPAAAPGQPGSEALGDLDARGWADLDHLTERVRGGHGLLSPQPRLGQVRYYHDQIYDASGTLIGAVAGRLEIVHRRPADGHMFAVRTEDVRLLGHTLRFTGLNDITAEFAGAWVSVPGVGLTGEYLGRSAIRAIHMTPTPLVSDVRIVMAR